MFEFFSEALATKADYVADLPEWVQNWMQFMQIVFGASLIFVWKYVEARWVLVSTAGSVVAALIWGGLRGFDGLWGLFHIVFYTPCLFYLGKRIAVIPPSKIYRGWLALVAVTMLVSLTFDWKDLVVYLLDS